MKPRPRANTIKDYMRAMRDPTPLTREAARIRQTLVALRIRHRYGHANGRQWFVLFTPTEKGEVWFELNAPGWVWDQPGSRFVCEVTR